MFPRRGAPFFESRCRSLHAGAKSAVFARLRRRLVAGDGCLESTRGY